MNYKVAVIAGDGIGPEIVREARKVLDKVGGKFGHTFEYKELLMGGCSIDVYKRQVMHDYIFGGRCA